jgi:hypothetical protein
MLAVSISPAENSLDETVAYYQIRMRIHSVMYFYPLSK